MGCLRIVLACCKSLPWLFDFELDLKRLGVTEHPVLVLFVALLISIDCLLLFWRPWACKDTWGLFWVITWLRVIKKVEDLHAFFSQKSDVLICKETYIACCPFRSWLVQKTSLFFLSYFLDALLQVGAVYLLPIAEFEQILGRWLRFFNCFLKLVEEHRQSFSLRLVNPVLIELDILSSLLLNIPSPELWELSMHFVGDINSMAESAHQINVRSKDVKRVSDAD